MAETRAALSQDLVADTALAIADLEGIGAVTTRRIAESLGVTPMALYWHFSTKEGLINGVADRVLDAVEIPGPTGSWAGDLRAVLTALVGALRAHPQLAEEVRGRMLVHEHGLALSERALEALASAGFASTEAAWLASHALRVAITMVTAEPVEWSAMPEDAVAEVIRSNRGALAALSAERFPTIVRHADPLAYCDDPDRFFRLAIEHYLLGVEGLAARLSVVSV